MKRKLFALLLAAAMSLTLLAGCSDTASSGSIAPAASGAGSGAAAQEEPYTVTMMFIGNTQDDEEKVEAVSYTHLDVYKRQSLRCTSIFWMCRRTDAGQNPSSTARCLTCMRNSAKSRRLPHCRIFTVFCSARRRSWRRISYWPVKFSQKEV